MQTNVRMIIISLLGVLVLLLALLPSAQAQQWVGNDNGEFDRNSYSHYVFVQGSLSAGFAWTPNNPNLLNQVSFQYNPDQVYSEFNQWAGDWFQTVIASDPNSCAQFFIQIYSFSGDLISSTPFPNNCQTVSGILSANAIWYIEEDMPGGSQINSVYFAVSNYPYNMADTIYPSSTLFSWIRSNICWCGGPDGGFDTFTAGGGSLYYGTGSGALLAISPPSQIATTENSNMPYTQFQGSGTISMTQSFGWPPPPSPCGGGCGH